MKSKIYILLIGLALNLSCDKDNDSYEIVHPRAVNFQSVLDEFSAVNIGPGQRREQMTRLNQTAIDRQAGHFDLGPTLDREPQFI